MKPSSCYEILGVGADATPTEITSAYQRGLSELRLGLASPQPIPAERLDALRAAHQEARAAASRQPVAAPAALAAGAARTDHYGFAFTGNGSEYFRIWIVNLFLTLITLGIYSAWAKVRRESYFHRNLRLDNAGFNYHGKPVAILKGRMLAIALLVALSVAQGAGPLAYGLAVLALLPVLPWLIVRAFRFRAHNTSYRGLRFSFDGSYRQALIAFIGYGVLAAASFGLLFPLFYRQQKKFVLDNLRYGNSRFGCGASGGQFYLIFLKPVGLAIGLMIAAGVLTAAGGQSAALLPIAIGATLVGLAFCLMPYIRVRTTNLVWNSVTLGRIGFSSDLRMLAYLRLIAGNLILTLLTLGLYWPWARVRLAGYRAACLEMHSPGALDSFVGGETIGAPAIGDEVSDLLDMDIAL